MSLVGHGNKPATSSVPTQMPSNTAMSRRRRLLGPAALVATAGGLAAMAVHDTQWIEWGLLALSGGVAAAGLGLSQRSLPIQVLARATAWTVLVPSILVTLFSFASGHAEWIAAALTAGSGGALLLARPMLNTAEARADFAPSSFRRWLLASATASAMSGIVAGLIGLDELRWHPAAAIPVVGLALAQLAAAVGVVRMRAWGILLGGLTSVLGLIAALFMLHDAAGFALALATIPGFMMMLPVLIAKRQRAKAEAASSYTRVASHVSFDDAPSRVRIADSASDPFEDESDSSDDAAAHAPAPAARAQA